MIPRRNLLTAGVFLLAAVVWTILTHRYEEAVLYLVVGPIAFAFFFWRRRRRG